MADKPKCGAWARSTKGPCQATATHNGRCRMHGGLSTGPKTADGRVRALANLRPFQKVSPEVLQDMVERLSARDIWCIEVGIRDERTKRAVLDTKNSGALHDAAVQGDKEARRILHLRQALARKEMDWLMRSASLRGGAPGGGSIFD